jgi:hypothetical protein
MRKEGAMMLDTTLENEKLSFVALIVNTIKKNRLNIHQNFSTRLQLTQ